LTGSWWNRGRGQKKPKALCCHGASFFLVCEGWTSFEHYLERASNFFALIWNHVRWEATFSWRIRSSVL
jgi:hypothetical protein